MPEKAKAVSIGKKIKKIRIEKKVTLNAVANETGLSSNYIKNLEAGKDIPPVGAILQIARALDIDSSMLLKPKSESSKRAYLRRTKNYAYTPLTQGDNKHIKAFKVKVPSMSDHQGVGYLHEGEEFVYVVKGSIEVTVGENVNKLKKGGSLHFNSSINHHLKNIGKTEAELIVVIYCP